jgi:hypothetical protein
MMIDDDDDDDDNDDDDDCLPLVPVMCCWYKHTMINIIMTMHKYYDYDHGYSYEETMMTMIMKSPGITRDSLKFLNIFTIFNFTMGYR